MQADIVKAQDTLLATQSGYKLSAQLLPTPKIFPPTTDQQQANYKVSEEQRAVAIIPQLPIIHCNY